QGAGAAHRRDEEWFASGPLVSLWFLCQCLPFAGAYAGLRHCGVVSGSGGDRAGGSHSHGEYVTAAAVEAGRAGGDEPASHLGAPGGGVAVSGLMDSGAGGGAKLRGARIHGVAGRGGSEPRVIMRKAASSGWR